MRIDYIYIWALCMGLLLCGTRGATAQTETSNTEAYQLDPSERSDLEELVAYTETTNKLLPKKKKKKEDKREERKSIDRPSINFGGVGSALTYLLYLGILILVVVIIVMIFSNVNLEKKLEDGPPLDLTEIDDIETIDAKSGLEIALEAENYREAVRMLFIQLLQVLVTQGSIDWKPKKTNRDYQREMSRHDKISHFRNLVMAYEQVWYGSEEIDLSFFNEVRKDFEQFYSTDHLKLDSE